MAWHASLQLRYALTGSGAVGEKAGNAANDAPGNAAGNTAREAARKTVCQFLHNGPLRVLQPLYPEGDAICHTVLVHPPGGVVAGDVLDVSLEVTEGAHALITTPGATRFYRSDGAVAQQQLTARIAQGARLEWLPLENIAYPGCIAENLARFEVVPGGVVLGWDITALGLQAAGQAFESDLSGRFTQDLRLQAGGQDLWLERGVIAANDARLLDSPIGFAGRRFIATVFYWAGETIPLALRDRLLDAAREAASAPPHGRATLAGATAPHARGVVLRAVAHEVESLTQLCRAVRGAWRQEAWGLPATLPRIWKM
jgi:urease accessory protein